ncbi:hypothetical protein KDA_46900 [Dictyobacter alpinus]|uniref:Uncharacterized protein n=1 Tax=Dictyobacter alpinus TaxID=2014873 RepID=A0A402BCZ0_9CHLR|nr:hypothetical protein [Dictyobacter alpinus]GCE29206.1 hypothetical protein KDA_46900 [Dictyobacter alpinus]
MRKIAKIWIVLLGMIILICGLSLPASAHTKMSSQQYKVTALSYPGDYIECVPTRQDGSPDGYGVGNGCGGGSFPWKVTTASDPTWTATWVLGLSEERETACHIWAYIPDNYAGAPHARWDVWTTDNDGLNAHWEGWRGYYINQNNITGWVDLGSYNNTNSTYYSGFKVTLSNQDDLGVSGWYIAAAALSFSCS